MARASRTRFARIVVTALALVVAGGAQAQPSRQLSGPEDFSGEEVQLTFDGIGLSNGSAIQSIDGVDFELDVGVPASYFDDLSPRETGPQGVGSLINFLRLVRPYPGLGIFLPGEMNRVSFELRLDPGDDVSVTLRSGGVDVDQVVMPSLGSDMFHFYGLENTAGFDEVWIDVIDRASGELRLDNLTFEPLAEDETSPSPVPSLACVAFEPPSRRHRDRRHHVFFRGLKAKLYDADGMVVGAADLAAPPVAKVLFTPAPEGDVEDVTADVVWRKGGLFTSTKRGSWMVFLKLWEMRAPGTYVTTMESGDGSEYVLDPTCSHTTIIRSRGRSCRHGRHHHHHD